jgi:tetratricopeptide (TPR) repeat protein
MLSLMGEIDEARELILRAVDLEAENFTSWCALAQLEWSVENYEIAEQAYSRALNCPEADLMAIHFEWGTSAAFAGDGTRAKSCTEAMQQIDPEDWRTLMTTGAYNYTDGDYEAAETSFEEAFEMALASREYFALESSVAILFDFLADTGREIETDRYVDRIFEEQVFTENVLQILLSQEGLTSNAAASHQVVLRSPSEPPAYRVYAVSAESPEQSEFFAQRFERRCDESVWNVHDIQQVGEPSPALLGVYWRSETMPEPPPLTEPLPE